MKGLDEAIVLLARPHGDARGAREEESLPELDCHVLLVEDSVPNRMVAERILMRGGAKVSTAENGQIALDMLLGYEPEVPYDIVLMDTQMPVLDGYSATRELRTAGYALPIIALTAHAMREDRTRCLVAGCDDYVSKPIKRRELIDAILEQLAKQ